MHTTQLKHLFGLNDTNRHFKHIYEAFLLGRFSCIPSETTLVNVRLQMLVTDIVVATNHHPTEMSPESLNAVRGYIAMGKFGILVMNNLMCISLTCQFVVRGQLISNHH